MVAENASMKSEIEKQAVTLKDWEKKDKDLKKKEVYLKGQKMKLDADKRALKEEKLDREHLSKVGAMQQVLI